MSERETMTRTRPTGRLAEMANAMKTRGDKLVIPTVEQYLISQQDFNDRKPDVLHVSEMAKKNWCERASYFRIKTGKWPEQPFKFGTQNIFAEGDRIHAKWQGWLQATGKLWGNWECDSCGVVTGNKVASALEDGWYDADDSHKHVWRYLEVALYDGIIYGHEDGAIDDRLIEFKSVGLGTLRHEHPELLAKFYLGAGEKKVYDIDGIWKNLKQPFRSHVRQANLYLYLAQQMGLPFKKCSIVYEFKPNQQTAEFVIRLSDEVVSPLIKRAEALEEALDAGQPPVCPYAGCKACGAYGEHQARRCITRKGNPLVRPAPA